MSKSERNLHFEDAQKYIHLITIKNTTTKHEVQVSFKSNILEDAKKAFIFRICMDVIQFYQTITQNIFIF